MRLLSFSFIAVLIAACGGTPDPSATATPAAPVDPSTVGTLSGQILLDGTPPPADLVRLDGDPKCVALAQGEERRTEYIVAGEGNSLQHAFVYVKDGLPARLYPVPAQPVVLDQQKCRYVPRVLGLQVGQPLTIRNSDPLMHNVRAEGAINQPFDLSTPIERMEVTRTFSTREVMVPVKCNVHAWMNAYIGVLEHPFFAVTDASGRFAIPDLPPGTYTVEVWHEKLGTQTQQVTIAAKETRNTTFTYKVS